MTNKPPRTAADVLALADDFQAAATNLSRNQEKPAALLPAPVRVPADVESATSMLSAQALDLDRLSTGLMARAATAPNVKQAELLLRLGLKAQAQCVRTLLAIGELKQPRIVAFVRGGTDDATM